MAAKSDPRDVVIERTFDAPRALLFEAFTDPKRLSQWWGPEIFTTRCELDARPGGALRIVMSMSAKGEQYPMTGVYREVVRPERIVYQADLSGLPASWHDVVNPARDRTQPLPGYPSTTTVTCVEEGGQTRLTVRTRFESAAVRDAFVRIGMTQGWGQSLDKLERGLTADREIVAVRAFDAPRALVWKVWTDPKHLLQWWGPDGFTTTIGRMEVRAGGAWEFVLHGPDGADYQNRCVYQEVIEPERITYRHLSGPVFRAVVTFAESHGKTVLTVRMIFATAAEREKVAKDFGAVEGLNQELGKLARHLQTVS